MVVVGSMVLVVLVVGFLVVFAGVSHGAGGDDDAAGSSFAARVDQMGEYEDVTAVSHGAGGDDGAAGSIFVAWVDQMGEYEDDFAVSHGVGGEDSAAGSSFEAWVDQMGAYEEQSLLQEESEFGIQQTAAVPKGRTIIVDKSGKGHYRTVQRAINSVPRGNNRRVTIVIRRGVYREKIRIIKQKPFIHFKCAPKTILVWGDTAAKAGSTSGSASTAVESDGFIATDCTFANSAPAPPGGAIGKQAVALRIQGDRGAFYRCNILGAQDTLYDKYGRHYFRSCYIRGSIDFIFGDGRSLYHFCKITSIAKRNSGSITAQKRPSRLSKTGFVFLRCQIGGTGSIYLGRAWGSHSRVVFIQCKMAKMILPFGWQDWNDPRRRKTVFYAEHRCTGPGSKRTMRAPWSLELTPKQARPFSTIRWIDGQSLVVFYKFEKKVKNITH